MTLNIKLILAGTLILGGLYLLTRGSSFSQTPPATAPQTSTPNLPASPSSPKNLSGSAKGVVLLEAPAAGQKITSPLLISGTVYAKKGKLTITLKQKESGAIVSEPKTVTISGSSDQIKFAEAIQFGLPAKPQTGILEINFKDESGRGADDKFQIEVEFPPDLGSGR